jgi:signal transduction histidine kinase
VAERSALGRLTAARWFDAALAAVLTAVPLVQMFTGPDLASSLAAAVLLVLVGVAVVMRRTHPVAGVSAAAVLVLASSGLDGKFPPDSAFLLVLVLCYSCGAHASERAGLLAIALLAIAMQARMGLADFPNVEILFTTAAPWWVGRQVGERRRLVRDLAERNRALETEQDAFARLSVRRERARIARELHDIVAHHLAVIVVQAGAGRMAAPAPADRAAERFRSIRQSGGQALAEMARLVDILHADHGEHARGRLRLLLNQADGGGLRVRVAPLPPDVRLPAEVEEVAYHVVQEGLTNAMKHAPGAEVQVRLTAAADTLEVEVHNDGASVRSALAVTGSGMGLPGMRERVESLGGVLAAEPVGGGGFRVHARLPLATRDVAPAR